MEDYSQMTEEELQDLLHEVNSQRDFYKEEARKITQFLDKIRLLRNIQSKLSPQELELIRNGSAHPEVLKAVTKGE